MLLYSYFFSHRY